MNNEYKGWGDIVGIAQNVTYCLMILSIAIYLVIMNDPAYKKLKRQAQQMLTFYVLNVNYEIFNAYVKVGILNKDFNLESILLIKNVALIPIVMMIESKRRRTFKVYPSTLKFVSNLTQILLSVPRPLLFSWIN